MPQAPTPRPEHRPTQDAPADRRPEASAPEPEIAAASVVSAPWTAPLRYRLGVHVAGQAVFGPAPGVLPVLQCTRWSRSSGNPSGLPRFSSAQCTWGARGSRNREAAQPSLSMRPGSTLPARFGAAAFQVRACGTGLLGRLSVEGTNTRNPAGLLNRPFAVAGGAAIAAAQLGSSVELVGRVATGSTLVRDSFEFTPSVFHTAAPLTLFVERWARHPPRTGWLQQAGQCHSRSRRRSRGDAGDIEHLPAASNGDSRGQQTCC